MGALPEILPPGPLQGHGAILAGPTKIHKKSGKLILSQKTRLWFRAAVCFWTAVVLLTPFMIYSDMFGPQTTHFTCDRAAGVCAVDGRTKDVPKLPEIRRAQMNRDSNRRDSVNWGIDLVTLDSKKYAIEQQRAVANSVVAEYRKTVKGISAYLADPAQQKLDIAFTYRAGLWEKFLSIFYLFFGVGTLVACFRFWTHASTPSSPAR